MNIITIFLSMSFIWIEAKFTKYCKKIFDNFMTLVVTLGSKVTAKSLVIVYIGDCWQR